MSLPLYLYLGDPNADVVKKVVGGPIVREITGALFIVAYVLLTGSGILGVSIAFNVFSGHAVCTNWFSFVAMILIIAAASFRKMSQVSWIGSLSMAHKMSRRNETASSRTEPH